MNGNVLKAVVLGGMLSFSQLSLSTPLVLDGSWHGDVCDPCSAGSFFGTTWEWTSSTSVKFDITDHFVIGESFSVYDFGGLIFSTADLPNYDELGVGAFDAGYYTSDPNVAFASALWSSGSFIFGAGSHSITIESLEDVPGFSDHHVRVRGTELPEPSLLGLLMLGLAGLFARRRAAR